MGLNPAIIPLWWTTCNIVATILSIPAGIVSDRIGRGPLIIFGYICFAVVYGGFGLAQSSAILWLLIVVYGLYKGLADGAQRTFVADLIPPERRGSAFGVYYTFVSLASLPSSVIAGFLWDKYGASAPFLFGAVMAIITAGLMTIFLNRDKTITE